MANIEFFLKFLCELLIIFIQELFSENVITQVFSFLKYLVSSLVIIYIITFLVFPAILISIIAFLLSYHSQDVKHLFWEYINKTQLESDSLREKYKDFKIKKIYLRKIQFPSYIMPILYLISVFIPDLIFYSLILEIEDNNSKKLVRIEKNREEYLCKQYNLDLPNNTFNIELDNETVESFLEKFGSSIDNEDNKSNINCKNIIDSILKHYKKENCVDNLLIKPPICLFNICK